jgi:hypothetical protein
MLEKDRDVNDLPTEEEMDYTEDTSADIDDAEPVEESPKKSKKMKDGQLRMADLYKAVTRAMNREFMVSQWPQFPTTYRVMRDEKGETQTIAIAEDGVALFVNEEAILADIAKYIASCKHLINFPRDKDCKEILKYWKRTSTPIKTQDIAMVLQASKPGITWRRLPWDLCDGPTPLFDDMMGRTTNSKSLMHFIGSLFFNQSDRQTYVWIYGKGGDGKGSLVSVLAGVLGDAYASENTRVNQFWSSGILGKRLVCFPDCEDFLFPTSGLFKQITGGDKIRVERKNQAPFTSDLICKCMFLSNRKPELSTMEADMRRVIYCEMTKPDEMEGAESYRARLWDEAKHFLYKCVKMYQEAYPTHSPIRADRQEIIEVAGEADEFATMIFDRHFEATPVEKRNQAIPDRDKPAVTANVVQAVLQHEKLNFVERRAFTRFLREKIGSVSKMVVCEDDQLRRKWLWIKEKEGSSIAIDSIRRV